MFDDVNGDGQVFDFDELANHLLEQGLQTSPSGIHGCSSGLLAAGGGSEGEFALSALADALDLHVHGELAEQVMALHTTTAAALADEEFEFHLLLPDDEVEIAQRTEAMAHWCKGFLAGFALAAASAGDSEAPAAMSTESSEILRDIAAIAEAGVDEQADEEESEESYVELVEYLRFAVLNLALDNAAS
ncbi:MAG: UPF0149 family protein [Pseudomonadota bacterium]